MFSKIVTSSIWSEPDHVRIVFVTMLALKKHDHRVYATAYQLSLYARKTEHEVLDALRVLSSPDTKRIEPQEFEGRRIEKQEDGSWLVLNGRLYQELMTAGNDRARKRRWAAEKRAQVKEEKKALKYALERGAA